MEKLGKHGVVVIGGGIMGCATAYYLAREGVDVGLIEKAVQVGTEASGRNAGGIRQNGRSAAELPVAMASVELWRSFRDELGGEFEYDENGQMYVARSEADAATLEQGARRFRSLGLNVQHVRGADLREICPNLSDSVVAGNYCATDGYVNPILATRFVAQCAQRAGATIYVQTRVTGLKHKAGRIYAVETNRGEIGTGAVVNTAGPWANEIAAMVGAKLPMQCRRTQLAATMPLPAGLRQFISGNSVYIRPTRAGNLLVGGGGSWDPLGFNYENSLSTIRRFAKRGAEIFPLLRQTSILRTWSGILSLSPDHTAIIDKMPGVENMAFATGFTGHGFCLGPGVGQILAELIQGRTPTIPAAALGLSRFPTDLDFMTLYKTQPEPA